MNGSFIPAYKDNKQVYVVEIPARPDDEDDLEQEERPLYERAHDENDWDFYLFTVYRDMNCESRSIKAVSVKMNLNYKNLHVKSQRYNWVKRASAWDDECDRIARETQLDVIKEMNERHARNSANLQSMLMLPAGILSNKIKQGGVAAFENMTMEDLFNIIVKVAHAYPNIAKLERTAKGEADEIKQNDVRLEANVNITEVKYNVVRTETVETVDDPPANDNP